MAHEEETEAELEFEAAIAEDGKSFVLQILSSESLTYGDFVRSIRTFLEAEEMEPLQEGNPVTH